MKIQRTRQFATWIDALKDVTLRARILARILARIGRLAEGHLGDHRYLADGVSELRIDAGPGYRVYYTQRGQAVGDSSGRRRQGFTAARYREGQGDCACPVSLELAVGETTQYRSTGAVPSWPSREKSN